MTNETTINESLPLGALTIGQARQFISGLISKELEVLTPQKPEQPKFDTISIIDAANYLRELGCFISKGTIYNLVAKSAIPYRKIGRRVVFSRSELYEWVQSKVEVGNSRSNATLTLAKSATRKR